MISVGINNHGQVLVTCCLTAVKGKHQGLPFKTIDVCVKSTVFTHNRDRNWKTEKNDLKVHGKILLYKIRLRKKRKKRFIFCQDVLFIVNT